ncbi:uncharacterized protein LOC112351107 isoform X1 [Selaginella moellendorffii]|uniref:uncharacterized protein LOC112351107 isoform X1 n=1 Tax=Selaginella moellendorffii TaxID=88036 RepID=UPI000D1C467F|nr:uncharacterized protein LOC112351107 isoform X1 [Selaginella moellendorffii]|eukprot:XP_024544169.1 uncharacterized protein LOC112351107 isoform X1 [Selaginella moellendorffii]
MASCCWLSPPRLWRPLPVQAKKCQWRRRRIGARICAVGADLSDIDATDEGDQGGGFKEGGARAKRLEKVRYEKQARKEKEASTYPEWARIFEDQARNDDEVREILGDSLGNPEEMEKRLRDRVLRKGNDLFTPKTGTAIPLEVQFRDFDPAGAFIWFELCGAPTEKDLDIIGGVFRSWYILGKLGAFNTLNMQLTKLPVEAPPKYSPELAKQSLPAYFHNIGDIEYQDTIGRVWVDLGTSDPLAWDVIINSLSAVSSDHVGMKLLVFGGNKFGDWEDGMKNPDDGYKVYKI